MPQFTPEQRSAIEARGEDLLVAAAAGSGKTTVLVERVLALIAEGVDVDRVCIVTFTRAAAADMREKLQRRLEASSGEDVRLRGQLDRLPLASIGTLHSFCAALIRERFEAAGVDPAFRILDGPEAERLQSAAMREAMDEVYAAADPEDLARLTCGRSADTVASLAAQLYRFIRNRPDPFGWMDAALAADPEAVAARCLDILAGDVRAMAREAAALAASAAEICDTPGGPFHYGDPLRADAALLEEIASLPGPEMARALAAFKPARPGRAKKDTFDEELLEHVKRLRDAAKAAAAKAADSWIEPDEAARDLAANHPALALLGEIVRALDRRLEAEKSERGVCDYADLEHRALRALADPEVRESVSARFDAVFVDEYQDISDVQESVIRAAARPGRLFMVGDVKQSIYRFRLAEPNLFLEKQRSFGAGEGGRLIALNRNFRSRANILRFTNEVFARAMRGEGSEMEYRPEDALVPGASFPGQDPLVEIALLSGEGEAFDGGEADGDDAPGDARAAEGLFIARHVRELLGTPLWDPRAGAERPLRYRDIVVLARTRQRLLNIRDVLEKEGVPCFADAGNAYADSMEVRHMLSLLGLIANGRSDTALLAALLSPGSGFGAEDVAAIRVRCPKGSFRDACDTCAAMEDELGGRLRRFFGTLDRWRLLSRALPLDHLVDLLLRETGFYAYAGALAGGERRRANLDLLCDLAASYAADHSDGLTGFLASFRLPRGSQAEQGEAQALGEGDDVVRLMTVHRSKGLEFPVVFGAQLERDFTRESSPGGLQAHKELGFGLELHDPALGTRRDTVLCLAARSLSRLENANEELRLLYVLCTRASDRLILTGRVKDIAASRARWMAAAPGVRGLRTWLDALAPAVPGLAAMENGEADVSLRVWDAASFGTPGALRAAEGRPSALADLEDALEAPAAPDSALDASYSWQYPFASATLSPLKVTVTALARETEGPAERSVPAAMPDFLSGEKRAMERGSAVHAALSALDLSLLRGLSGAALDEAVARQLDRFAQEGILRPEMREAVRPAQLRRFFEEPLGRRMLEAAVIRREWPFNLRMSAREALRDETAPDTPLLVQGVIDCCFQEEGKWVLLDYKTDAADDEAALLARYAPQLRLYRRALEEITGLGVAETWLCLLRSGHNLPVD